LSSVQLRNLLKVVTEEFGDIVTDARVIEETRLRIVLKDNSTMDIFYPRTDKYSFHWRRKDEIVRINTAPHHPGPTFPRHVHLGSEERVVPDEVTSLDASPEENIRRVLSWVRKQPKK